MRPQSPPTQVSGDLFRSRLENILDLRHELCQLADQIPWTRFDEAFGDLYSERTGSPGKPIRLMAGLQYLKHLYGLSDEAVVRAWRENPYWQYYCGEAYFRHDEPVDGSSMTRFRQRIGESGCELLLQGTIETGLRSGVVKPLHVRRVTVDTTVQEKAVSFPTDSKLLNRSRQRLGKWSQGHHR